MTGVKFCEGCGKQAAASARFCGGCGDAFPEPEAAEPTEPETSGGGGRSGGAGEAPAASAEERELFNTGPLPVQSFVELGLCILTFGIAWLFLWIRRIDTRYWITDERIEVTTGVFHKTTAAVELFRIQDYELVEPLFLRLRGSGHVVVRSMDPEEGEITLRALPDAQLVYETLRKMALGERGKHNVRLLEGM